MSDNPTILSRSELGDLLDADDDLTLVEVLDPEQFADGHLPGAINIPGDRLRDTAPTLIPDRHRTVVVYCASPACTASDRAARVLADMGYTDVRDYRGGKEHWKEGGGRLVTEHEAGAPAP